MAHGPDVARRHVLFGLHGVLKVGKFHIKKKFRFPASHERLEAVTTPGPHSRPATIHPPEASVGASLRKGGSDSFTGLEIHTGTCSVPGSALLAGNSTGKKRHILGSAGLLQARETICT